jgi:hypothetical protein
MGVSFLLTLVPEELSAHRIAGRVEVVETGERSAVRNSEELIGFLYEHGAPGEPEPGEGGRVE